MTGNVKVTIGFQVSSGETSGPWSCLLVAAEAEGMKLLKKRQKIEILPAWFQGLGMIDKVEGTKNEGQLVKIIPLMQRIIPVKVWIFQSSGTGMILKNLGSIKNFPPMVLELEKSLGTVGEIEVVTDCHLQSKIVSREAFGFPQVLRTKVYKII